MGDGDAVSEESWVETMTGFRLSHGIGPEAGCHPEPDVFYAFTSKISKQRDAESLQPCVQVNGRTGLIHPIGSGFDLSQVPVRSLWFNAALLALLFRGGLLVHAAGAVLKGRGLVFPAVSGTGKSTLSRLLEAEFPGAVVCDERIALRPATAHWILAGTPWESTAGIARETAAPLAALVFLEQAPACAIEPISAPDALRRVLPLISVDWGCGELADRGAAALDALLAAVPAYVFRFPKSPAAAHFLASWAETV